MELNGSKPTAALCRPPCLCDIPLQFVLFSGPVIPWWSVSVMEGVCKLDVLSSKIILPETRCACRQHVYSALSRDTTVCEHTLFIKRWVKYN